MVWHGGGGGGADGFFVADQTSLFISVSAILGESVSLVEHKMAQSVVVRLVGWLAWLELGLDFLSPCKKVIWYEFERI